MPVFLKPFFKLYANCIPVSGSARSIICDLQRNNYEYVPSDLIALFDEDHKIDLSHLSSLYDSEDLETIHEYITFLLEKEFGFYCDPDELDFFPLIHTIWDFPALITNAIIDSDEESEHDFRLIFEKLQTVQCRHFQFRFFHKISLDELKRVHDLFKEFPFLSADYILPYSDSHTDTEVLMWLGKQQSIRAIYYFGANEEYVVKPLTEGMTMCVKLKEMITDETHCGAVHPSYFSINYESFFEARLHNSCLNRKLSVDKKGYVKNCPSQKTKFGHIQSANLKEIVNQPAFKTLWDIKKDQIETCKDCEFRYICTDCRVYVTDPESNYSKPSKCNYNPYLGEWTNAN